MRVTGVEPAHRKIPDPKSGASANSAIPARVRPQPCALTGTHKLPTAARFVNPTPHSMQNLPNGETRNNSPRPAHTVRQGDDANAQAVPACGGWVLAAAVLAGAGMYALRRALPDTFTVQPGQTLAIASMPWLSAQPGRAASGEVPASAGAADGSQTQTLALFDLIRSRRCAPSLPSAQRGGLRHALRCKNVLQRRAGGGLFGPVHQPWQRKPRQGGRPAAGRPDHFGGRAHRAQQR